MALIKCSECGKSISQTAMSCPNCGFTRECYCQNCYYYGKDAWDEAYVCTLTKRAENRRFCVSYNDFDPFD